MIRASTFRMAYPRRVQLGDHGGDPHDGADRVLLVHAPLGRQEVQRDRVLHGEQGEHRRSPQVDSEGLAGPAVVGDHPADERAPGEVGEPVEPLDDVTPERMDRHDEEEDGLVPDDPPQELLQVAGPRPVDMEEADQGGHEHQQVGHAEVGAGATHPLDQDGTRQHDHGHEDRIGHEDAEGQHHQGHGQARPRH